MTVPGFVSRAERLGQAFDLLAAYGSDGFFFERNGLGVAGTATGSRYLFKAAGPGAPDVPEMLASTFRDIQTVDGGGVPPPLVFVSVPFDRQRNATVVQPNRTVRRDRDGQTWAIHTTRTGDGSDPQRADWRSDSRTGPHDSFSAMQVRPNPAPDAYERAVVKATDRIRAGALRKVVLARSVEVAAGRSLDPAQLLWRLRAVDPDCYVFAVATGNRRPRVLVGASPELLVERIGRRVRSNPLAGSAPRSGDPERDRASGEGLLASDKDREEHVVVVEAVEDALAPFCVELTHDPEPVLLGTANVWHLSTRFEGTLREPAADALTLALALHPTPAVCGTPQEAAASLIRELEPFERDGYAGPVGWVDASGDGVFAIALRCAELCGDVARLFAGAGIVAGSVPELELDETECKFRALLDALRWS